MEPTLTLAAQRAVADLAVLRPRTRSQAAALLDCWAHRATLTDTDRAAVIAVFARPRRTR